MRILLTIVVALGVSVLPAAAQTDPAAPRSTTERPNLSAPGMEQTITGVLMDATCSAIADSRSELTKTPRLLPPSATRGRSSESAAPMKPATETAVPDTYRNCRLKPSTTSFAVYADRKVYMLDRISNQMMQEHMLKARNPDAKWTTLTVLGTTTSDDVLTLRSIKK